MLFILLAWIVFGVLHSGLASLRFKALIYRFIPQDRYRLFYNGVSLLSLLPGLLLTQAFHGDVLFEPPVLMKTLLGLIALWIFYGSSRGYDLRAFLGLREEPRHLQIDGLHGYVRHPWYLAGLLLLWSQTMSEGMLMTQICLTLYILIGIYFEEQKLIALFGERYRDYQKRVPMLIPKWPRSLGQKSP